MEGVDGRSTCLSSELSERLSRNRCHQKRRCSNQTTKSRSQFVLHRLLILSVFLTITFQPNMAERLYGEGLRTDVKYDGSRTSGLRHLSRLQTIIKNLRFLQGQNLLEQQNYDDDDDDDQQRLLLWPSYEIDDNDDDNSAKGDRSLSAGSRHGTDHNDDFIPRSMLKRGQQGSCINSCMVRGMSFIRCKSMCN